MDLHVDIAFPAEIFNTSITTSSASGTAISVNSLQGMFTSTFSLTDPSGEYIAGGNPADVSISANLVRDTIKGSVTGDYINMEFQTVPEPSSIVMAASGALLVLTSVLVRARRMSPYKPRSALTW
jgi:hypothetical protein